MQLCTIRHDERTFVAVRVSADTVSEVNAASMLELIESGTTPVDTDRTIPIADIDIWLAPLPNPGKVLGVAMNNSASNERKISAPDHPAFFLKPPSCLIGHREPIVVRPYYGSVHPEPELAAIIGKTTRDADVGDAADSIFGYSIFNDVTGNGMRAEDMFHYWALYADGDSLERREQHLSYAARYKGSDTFGCMGPWLTSADGIDPENLDVVCSVGGELIAEDSTRYYNYSVFELISYVSHFQTLYPGDIISCGTAFKPGEDRRSIHHANLQTVPGPVDVRIAGLGELSNPVIIDDRPIGRWRSRKENES